MCGLPLIDSPNLLVGLETPDDAGVYKITDDIALVQTVDFFTPIVDDPFLFGQIAAANSLSDIYAMGARPITAMNLLGFPEKGLDKDVLREILRGGMTKIAEAKVVLVGGHSIDDSELKYGLSVTGLVHPEKILTKKAARTHDTIFLTKPLGTGIIATAIKAKAASSSAIEKAVAAMITLNNKTAKIIQGIGIHACTDITGFGLVGHALEVAKASNKGICITTNALPVFQEAIEYAGRGMVPGGTRNNQKFYEPFVEYRETFTPEMRDILYDPQTSGGLFFSLAPEKRDALLALCKKEGIDIYQIGEVLNEPAGRVVIEK